MLVKIKNKNCFEIDSIYELVRRQQESGKAPTNPMTREKLTEDEIDRIYTMKQDKMDEFGI